MSNGHSRLFTATWYYSWMLSVSFLHSTSPAATASHISLYTCMAAWNATNYSMPDLLTHTWNPKLLKSDVALSFWAHPRLQHVYFFFPIISWNMELCIPVKRKEVRENAAIRQGYTTLSNFIKCRQCSMMSQKCFWKYFQKYRSLHWPNETLALDHALMRFTGHRNTSSTSWIWAASTLLIWGLDWRT